VKTPANLDWRHYAATAVLLALLIAALWKQTLDDSPKISDIKAQPGAHAMVHDPNSP
jgi:hypothetical protein